MKLCNINDVADFKDVVNQCKGKVLLKSTEGDVFNVKSTLSQYIAIGELLKTEGNDLELYCDEKQDEELFIEFFKKHSAAR